ncbi:MAG: 2-C-methyl-D-erythritol 2,4-cyclodiphosphate synthase [Actinomycetota bacterium]
MTQRVGHGYDIHRFSDEPDRPLVLGGVTIEGSRGLEGHSDADAIAHAAADAVLGPAGLGDLGRHFPDDDERWAGADSLTLLSEVVRLAGRDGWRVVNIDVTVVAQAPKLAPHREAMQQRLSDAAGAPVTVKATTAEGLGPVGRGEAIAAHAVALLESS